jgi:hypothetical protein
MLDTKLSHQSIHKKIEKHKKSHHIQENKNRIFNHYFFKVLYTLLRSVSSLNNPQNSEMKICENMKLTC